MKWTLVTCVGAAVAAMVAACGSDVSPSFPGGSSTSSSSSTGSSSSSSSSSSGQGGAGQGGSGQGGAGQGGAATCLGCVDILQGGDPNEACTMNGPPTSAEIWADFNQCVCIDNCSMECGMACQGGQPDQACQQCVQGSCPAEAQACFQDGGMGMCSTCSEVLQGMGDPANLCGPSQALLGDLLTCVCQDNCTQECGDNACMGMQPSNQCQACVGGSCGAELQACLND